MMSVVDEKQQFNHVINSHYKTGPIKLIKMNLSPKNAIFCGTQKKKKKKRKFVNFSIINS